MRSKLQKGLAESPFFYVVRALWAGGWAPVLLLILASAAPSVRAALPAAEVSGETFAVDPAAEDAPAQDDSSPAADPTNTADSVTADSVTGDSVTAEPTPAGSAVSETSDVSEEAEARSGPQEGRGLVVPDLDIFFPEGEFDLRLHRLIDRIFFEGQLKYDFVDGDITAFLRYRYYGYDRVYQLSVFDAIEFEGVEELSDEFERVRGVLFLTQWSHNYHRRTFFATELNGISSNKEDEDDGKVNTFVRLGYQIGTPDDTRSNAIVGEPRAQVQRLFTPFRAIGPGDAGFTSALTWGFDYVGADFDYLKLEMTGLKRFELPKDLFLIGRIRAGTFLHHGTANPDELVLPTDTGLTRDELLELDPTFAYLIPRAELFELDGRDNLKTLRSDKLGTEVLNTTWELLMPWFVDADRKVFRPSWRTSWQTWYWVLYAGYGTLGVDPEVFTEPSSYVADVGVGFQSSLQVKGYRLFLSALVGQALESGSDIKVRFSFKSYH